MHRGDLAGLWHAAAKKFTNIESSSGSVRARRKNGKAVVSFTESGDRQRTIRAFALVGADGVNSAVRRQWLGGTRPDYSGKVAWRALVPPQSLEGVLNLDRVSVLFGTRHHLVVYPLPHRQTVNLALFTQERQRDLEALEKGQPSLRNTKDRRLATILAAAGKSWTPWVLAAVEIEHWHKGAVGLIGDAAHAMLPFQAQGAAMGIDCNRRPLLATASNPEEAFARYASLRQERQARAGSIAQQWPHLPYGLLLRWRDMVIRAQGPEEHFKRPTGFTGRSRG